MKLNIYKNKWLLVTLITTTLIPIIITATQLIMTEKDSVIFLEGAPAFLVLLVLFYYGVLFGLGVYWLTKQIIASFSLKNEKAKTELMLFKSQVNPHFFFNMLNNLYGLVAKDPKKAQELILKLSDLMRYNIYEGEKDTVTLKEEVEYLNLYLQLHQMRYHKTINIKFHQEINEAFEVMPSVFIILLENAFKHGVERLREDAYIDMSLVTQNEELQFSIENNFDEAQVAEESGIGLQNLKRRLELVYPKRHKLTSETNGNVYKVQLTLNNK